MFHKTCFSPIFKFLIVGHAPFNSKITKVNLKPHMGHPPWESNSQQSAFNIMSIRTTITQNADSIKLILKSSIPNCKDAIIKLSAIKTQKEINRVVFSDGTIYYCLSPFNF